VTDAGLATRLPIRLSADPTRVIADLFVPGHAIAAGPERRVSHVVEHVLSLSDAAVEREMARIVDGFADRHRDLRAILRQHADRIRNRLDPGVRLDEPRWLLLGATFTQERSVESAALCNPSAIEHPDQSGVANGSLRFLLSVRQIGEGHRSSIGFRTGVVGASGAVAMDATTRFTTAGAFDPARLRGERLRDGSEATDWVIDRLGETFTRADLDARLEQLGAQRDTRRDVQGSIDRMRTLADRTYTTVFPSGTPLGEQVLEPSLAAEANGIEDARFVRLVDGDHVRHCATYVAYDGARISQQLLETDDLLTYRSSPLRGAAASDKGLALFPRRIAGRYFALTRSDGASNAVTTSDDLLQWPDSTPLTSARRAWESVQVGNCGSPIETDAGWLVLTHGVGAMRTYSIGACLLDLDDPTVVLGRLEEPLLSPTMGERDGYVPNVVYSCGALRHGDHLMLPFGMSDAAIGFASVRVQDLIDAMAA
jgi:predicted GH43/DUF377 family glycosyl hydrolase